MKGRIKEALEQIPLLEEMKHLIVEYQELLQEVMWELKKDRNRRKGTAVRNI